MKYELILLLLIGTIVIAIYGQVADHEFILFDDYTYVVENSYLLKADLEKSGASHDH